MADIAKIIKELRELKPQLLDAAQYAEEAFLASDRKDMELRNTQEYTVTMFVSLADRMSAAAASISQSLEEQAGQLASEDVRTAALTQRVKACWEYAGRNALHRLQQPKAACALVKRYSVAEASVAGNPGSQHDLTKQQQAHPSSVFSVDVKSAQHSSASASLPHQHALLQQNQQHAPQQQQARVGPEDMAMKREVFSLDDDTSAAGGDDLEDRSALHPGFSDLLKIPPLRGLQLDSVAGAELRLDPPQALPSLQECLDLLAGTRTSSSASMAVTTANAAASSANQPSRASRFFSGSLRKPSISVEGGVVASSIGSDSSKYYSHDLQPRASPSAKRNLLRSMFMRSKDG